MSTTDVAKATNLSRSTVRNWKHCATDAGELDRDLTRVSRSWDKEKPKEVLALVDEGKSRNQIESETCVPRSIYRRWTSRQEDSAAAVDFIKNPGSPSAASPDPEEP